MGLFDYITGLFKSKPKAYTSPWHEFTKYDQYKLGQMHGQTRYPEDYLTRFPHNPARKAYESGIGSSASPAFAYSPSVSGSGGGGGVATYKAPKKPKPKVPTLSLDEMIDIINRRVGLMIDPQIEALRRGLDEERLAHERRVGDVGASYEDAMEQLRKTGQQQQREAASSMRKRGLFESGIAVDLANRIQRQMGQHQAGLEKEQARALSELADYLALRERQTGDEIKELKGSSGDWKQSLLKEMELSERDRRDRLEQQAFENWLSEQAMQHQVWQANQAARYAGGGSGAAPRAPTFKDILDQAMMQTFATMPGQQQRQLIMSQMFPQPQQPSYSDQMDQMRLQWLRGLDPKEWGAHLFPASNIGR